MKRPAGDSAIAFQAHDHSHCCGDLLRQADDLAAMRGARLTPVRRRVLEILLERHRALGAYEVLDRLAQDGFGNKPPVAYRALDFLVEQGLAHKVARLNAFMACTHPGRPHSPAVLICRACQTVAEAPGPTINAAIVHAAAEAGFAVQSTAIEILGLCPACREDAQ